MINLKAIILNELNIALKNINESLEKQINDLTIKQTKIAKQREKLKPDHNSINNKLGDIKSKMDWAAEYSNRKIQANQFINLIVAEINFITPIPDELQNYANEYGCFYDRNNFYYNEELANRNNEEITQIFLCEFLNNWQNIIIPYNCLDSKKEYITGTSLLIMNDIGIIQNKLPCSSSLRRDILNRLSGKVIYFYPKQEVANYFLFRLIDEQDNNIGEIIETKTLNMIEASIKIKQIYRLDYRKVMLDFSNDFNYYTMFYTRDENNKITKFTRKSNLVKDHEESVNITKKLSGEVI